MNTNSTAPAGTVVVGTDGTATALHAVEWAVVEAGARGVPLRIVHAAPYATDAPGRRRAATLLARAFTVAHRRAPAVETHTELIVDEPVVGLVRASENAGLLVIGIIGERTGDVVLGSVAPAVTGAAHCPVTVVRRGHRTDGAHAIVVVGVESAPADAAALRVAFAEADVHDARLVVLHTRPFPSPSGADPAPVDLAALAPWSSRHPGVPVEVRVVHGTPAEQLLHAAHEAQMVVVAHRGRSAAARAVAGSVGRGLLRSSACPVTVVHRDLVPAASSAHHSADYVDPHDRTQLW
ncbi:universal stress protein [Pseudonocardia sp. GCM10023141]|uniref:universal stress protein n=1 Tax=Pseudonocardia sp. GCM10023141 TaxID=3252653 RepID=UPI0036143C11